MLFNSLEFIFAFLPLVVIIYYMLCRLKWFTYAKGFLLLASLFFYGYWNYRYLLLISASMIANYFFAKLLSKRPQKSILILGVTANLLILGYYKYMDFFLENLNALAGTNIAPLRLVLPLAISFFTFQQLAFLVDAYRKLTKEYNFLNYALFVVFFPQLIAGPIVHHKDIIPQFQNPENSKIDYRNLSLGLSIFIIGLFKKVVIADTLANWVGPGFDVATSLSFVDAWGAALSYTLQLYFDFSGYSEMAIGLALLFNIKIAENFLSPYKANSIIDFWKRWHITLSHFLRDYLYISLGGNRKGQGRRYVNLFVTMVLGGLWHGAGWTFIIWGALHGTYLMINHGYRFIKKKIGFKDLSWLWGRPLTFLSVILGWVFFRAHSFTDAFKVLKGMLGQNGIDSARVSHLPGGRLEVIFLLLLLLWVNFAPNTMEFSKRMKFQQFWAIIFVFMAVVSLLQLNKISAFLYFQF